MNIAKDIIENYLANSAQHQQLQQEYEKQLEQEKNTNLQLMEELKKTKTALENLKGSHDTVKH